MNILGNVWQAIGRVFDLIEEMCGALIDGLESQQPTTGSMYPMMPDVVDVTPATNAHAWTGHSLMEDDLDPVTSGYVPGNEPLNGIIGTTIGGRNIIETNTLF